MPSPARGGNLYRRPIVIPGRKFVWQWELARPLSYFEWARIPALGAACVRVRGSAYPHPSMRLMRNCLSGGRRGFVCVIPEEPPRWVREKSRGMFGLWSLIACAYDLWSNSWCSLRLLLLNILWLVLISCGFSKHCFHTSGRTILYCQFWFCITFAIYLTRLTNLRYLLFFKSRYARNGR